MKVQLNILFTFVVILAALFSTTGVQADVSQIPADACHTYHTANHVKSGVDFISGDECQTGLKIVAEATATKRKNNRPQAITEVSSTPTESPTPVITETPQPEPTQIPEWTPTPRPAACNDGRDNDHDGQVDWPADTTCSSLNDTSEYGGGEDDD